MIQHDGNLQVLGTQQEGHIAAWAQLYPYNSPGCRAVCCLREDVKLFWHNPAQSEEKLEMLDAAQAFVLFLHPFPTPNNLTSLPQTSKNQR